jgi:hypothetical protein
LISAFAALPTRIDSTAAKPQTMIFFIVLLPLKYIFSRWVILNFKQSALQAAFAGMRGAAIDCGFAFQLAPR